MDDVKKVICRTLTNVLRQSPLSLQVEPKSFFMMLNSNFHVLFRDDALDLAPLWDALVGAEPNPRMFGLFIRFEQAAAEHGISVRQPHVVSALTPEQRTEALAQANADVEKSIDLVNVEDDDDLYRTDPNAEAIPLSLGTGDMKPIIPEETRRQIVQIVVQSLKAAPVGQRLDSSQLAYLVDGNFDDLCDGRTFDFEPILGGLRQMEGVKDADIYVGVIRLERALAELDIALEPLHLDVEPELAFRLVEEADAREREAAREAAVSAAAAMRGRSEPRKKTPAPLDAGPPPAPTKGSAKERRLRRWGLSGVSGARAKLARYVVLATLLFVAGGFGWAFRPTRGLDPADYRAAFPLKSAELRDGVFYGVVDDAKWWVLSPAQRQERIDALGAQLRAEGRIPNAQVRDAQGRLVLTGVGGKKLQAARFFAWGAKDGTIPDSVRIKDDTPPEGRAAAARRDGDDKQE